MQVRILCGAPLYAHRLTNRPRGYGLRDVGLIPTGRTIYAVIAQIVERLVEAQKVVGAVPTRSTIYALFSTVLRARLISVYRKFDSFGAYHI